MLKREDLASDEEMYMLWYLEELTKKEYLTYSYQPKSFITSTPVKHHYEKTTVKKTKTTVALTEYELLSGSQYTADFRIDWTEKAQEIFFTDIDKIYPLKHLSYAPFLAQYSKSKQSFYSVIDVKGTFNQHNNVRQFQVSQKLVYDRYKVYVQKIITAPAVSKAGKINPKNALFHSTFIPHRYLFNNKDGKLRKINFPYVLFDEFINKRKEFIFSLNHKLI